MKCTESENTNVSQEIFYSLCLQSAHFLALPTKNFAQIGHLFFNLSLTTLIGHFIKLNIKAWEIVVSITRL